MCSVATNLMNSLEFIPIRFATTPCCFGHARNGSVTTHSILLSSAAKSGATSDYVALERFGQNKEPSGNNKERATK